MSYALTLQQLNEEYSLDIDIGFDIAMRFQSIFKLYLIMTYILFDADIISFDFLLT